MLLAVVFVAILAVAYYLLYMLLRQESKKPGRNWNLVGIMALLLPPIMGLGAVLGIAMFNFFLTQLHDMQQDIQRRVFLRNLQPQERQLRMALTGSNADEGLNQLRSFLLELERQERVWANPDLSKALEQWNQCYLGLLFIAEDYQGMVSWSSVRVARYQQMAVFPAAMAVAIEAIGKDGTHWIDEVESSRLAGPEVDFMRGFLARNNGLPDSALRCIRIQNDVLEPVDFLNIAALGEEVRAQTDLGRYGEGRNTVIQRLEPMLRQSHNPLLESYIITTRCYLEIHYYTSRNGGSLSSIDIIKDQLRQAISLNPESAESRALMALYWYLTQDAAKADYYFNDLRAHNPGMVMTTLHALTKMQQNNSQIALRVHFLMLESLHDGLMGQPKEVKKEVTEKKNRTKAQKPQHNNR